MAFYGLLVVLILDYIRPGVDAPMVSALKLYTVAPLFVFLASLVSESRNTHSLIWKSTNTRWLVFFVLWIFLSSFTAIQSDNAFIRLNQAFGYFLLFYMLCRTADSLDRIKAIMGTLLAIHVWLVIQNPEMITDNSQRHYLTGVSFLGDGNDFALSVVLVFPMGVFLLLESQAKWSKLLVAASLIILLFAVVGTQSRGGSLAMAVVFFYLWRSSQNRTLGLVFLLGIAAVSLFVAGDAYFQRMETLSNIQVDGSAQGRLNAWRNAVNMAAYNPILGVGAGNFPLANGGLTAHSVWFLALGELGLPGFAFSVGFFFMNVRRNIAARSVIASTVNVEDRAYARLFTHLTASFMGFGVAGTFLSALYYPHIFILGGLALAAHAAQQRAVLSSTR